jgi:threonine aldolase
MNGIDLRSDTVTRPTPEMRQAMYDAEVADDGLEGDPTTQRLEEMAAERLGTEAALLVASGSMGNLVAALAHCAPGDAMIVGERSHMAWSADQGKGHSTYGQISVRRLPENPDGKLGIEDIGLSMAAESEGESRVALVNMENTHNASDGRPIDPAWTASFAADVHDRGAALHIDGARLFNAAVAQNVPASALVADADSATFCLSKGLACPIGGIVAGTRDYIAEAHNRRKIVGGEMRQTGVISAAGIVALDTMVDRMTEDHANARQLAEGLAQISGINIDPERVTTNILYFTLSDRTPEEIEQSLAEEGVHCFALDGRIRMVTHHHITAKDIETTLGAVQRIIQSGGAAHA